MQTTTQHNRLNNSITYIAALFIMTFSAVAQADESIGDLALFDTTDKWQMNRLFEPSSKQREKETQGQIMIYDGLRDTTVKEALDENFDRIENMMFTRVVVTNLKGQPQLDKLGNQVIEDDGC
jgi:hypothetical protein